MGISVSEIVYHKLGNIRARYAVACHMLRGRTWLFELKNLLQMQILNCR